MSFQIHSRPRPAVRHGISLCLAVAVGNLPASGGAQTFSIAPQADPLHGLQNVAVEYDQVSGTDEQSINASIEANSPRRPDGNWAMGQTRYTSRYRPLQITTKGVCKVAKLESQLGAIVVLPRLSEENSVPQRILAKWRPFIAALKEHEAGHIRLEYQHIHDFAVAIVGTSCSSYQAAYAAHEEASRATQEAYDRDTDSGATQGAVLH
ncbi:DUF922 domain-containing protein [Sphingomonas sp. PB2P12]|uniref:DUF922 domain-containing protein n=1 Tax=Sphingomonas sandaracina TaxID=3096157 RepID=UPI002FCC7B1D